MSDQNAPTDYTGMYQEPVVVEPVVPERVFGATSVVDGTPLVYDETNSMWVLAENHDEPWVGADPEASPIAPEPELAPDSQATFVAVNIDAGGNLRLREEAPAGAVLALIPNETPLQVISSDNPEWPFVEYANGANEPLRGYVKGSLVVEIPAQ